MPLTKNKKKEAKVVFILLGLILILVSVGQLLSIVPNPQDFNGRWGWLHFFIFQNFGSLGEPIISILAGLWLLFVGLFKIKD